MLDSASLITADASNTEYNVGAGEGWEGMEADSAQRCSLLHNITL